MTTSSRKSFRTVPGCMLPVLTPDHLAQLQDLSKQFNIEQIRFTPTSQLSVAGLDSDSFQDFCHTVSTIMVPLPDNGITAIHTCNTYGQCTHEFIDTRSIVKRLNDLDLGQPLPAKLKFGVAGCTRCCTMVRVRDIGIFPTVKNASSWNISFGGNGGYNPRISDIIATDVNEDHAIDTVFRAVAVYRQHAKKHERTSAFLVRYGIENFLREIEKNSVS